MATVNADGICRRTATVKTRARNPAHTSAGSVQLRSSHHAPCLECVTIEARERAQAKGRAERKRVCDSTSCPIKGPQARHAFNREQLAAAKPLCKLCVNIVKCHGHCGKSLPTSHYSPNALRDRDTAVCLNCPTPAYPNPVNAARAAARDPCRVGKVSPDTSAERF